MKHLLFRMLIPPVRRGNAVTRRIVARTHWFQYKLEGFLQGSAEWFDHEIDACWQWPTRRRSLFLERGVLSTFTMPTGSRVLELCSGDGFNAQRFYAERAAEVVAVDHNGQAVAHARRYHPSARVRYTQGDITAELPVGPFDRIVWDAAMHHFSDADIDAVLASAATRLRPEGLLSGYTVIESTDDYAYLITRFGGASDVAERLCRHFPEVAVLETPDCERRNLYFFAAFDHRQIPVNGEHAQVTRRSASMAAIKP